MSSATARRYSWVLSDFLRLATILNGEPVSVLDLLRQPCVLGKTFAAGERGSGIGLVSAWLAAQRRSVVRCFTRLMAVELSQAGINDPEMVVTNALRNVAEPVGTGFRLPVGWPRGRGGPTPSQVETARLISETNAEQGWLGHRNSAFLQLLARRGVRVGSLLKLDGHDVHRLPDGSLRMVLRVKSSRVPQELSLPSSVTAELEVYISTFNQWARVRGLDARIGVGVAGHVWRANSGGVWTYNSWRETINTACSRANLPRFTAHSFRRSFATDAVAIVSRSLVAAAGSWKSPRRMDDHYVHPSKDILISRLSNLQDRALDGVQDSRPTDEAVVEGVG